MIGLAVRCSVIFGVLLTPTTRGIAVELDIGARFPAEPSEKIVVKNDASVRNETAAFTFGDVCYSSDQFKTWFVVLRIVGDQVLVEFECIPRVFGDACPNGTQTRVKTH
jgi:hypothetical protein